MIKDSNNSISRVLFLSPLPPPYYGSAISSEMCLNILKGDKTLFVKNIKLNYSKSMSDIGTLNLKKIKGFFSVTKKIIFYKRKFNPDIIYMVPATSGFGLIRDFIFVSLIDNNRKSQLIIHLRSQFLPQNFKSSFWKILIKKILRCDKQIIIGKELIDNLNGFTDLKKIFFLPNAIKQSISDEEFDSIVQKRNLNKKLHLLFLSNMVEAKGWFKVLEACVLLKNAGINFKCNFVGDWETENDEIKFANYRSKYNLEEQVFFLGRLINKAKNNILAKTDILIFPTEYKLETFGRVIIEAMEYGIPVIANNIATIPSIIDHGVSGFVLSKNTPKEILNYILEMNDKYRRSQMSKMARKFFLEKYTLEKYAPKFIEIIKSN